MTPIDRAEAGHKQSAAHPWYRGMWRNSEYRKAEAMKKGRPWNTPKLVCIDGCGKVVQMVAWKAVRKPMLICPKCQQTYNANRVAEMHPKEV